ncbi:Peptidoglycan-binding domain 1 [hydrothermal vent metagenome]|uniref:Peptidoglycan-binding domain 1 n=1 Tax=hydrothermal vent metagenome TaxID=652676 RepID=A0A1W1EHR9_9ZZZZ
MIYRLLAVVLLLAFNGCTGLNVDSNGWRESQRSEFKKILAEDKYLSICNQRSLYKQVLGSNDSKLMSKLLVAYSNNLANGCIDMKSFNASQRAKKAKNIDTYYKIDYQKVDANLILTQLKEGKSIEEILAPYVPTYPQFKILSDKYKSLLKDRDVNKKLLRKMRINIERIKMMTHNLGKNYLIVNVPDFNVRFIEDGKTSLMFGVVVGKYVKQTPIFSSLMKYIVINPTWNIPDSIARKSIIPRMVRDSGYLARRGIVIRKAHSLESAKVNRNSVNWKPYIGGKGYVPYKFIQKPSTSNALGRVKFIFPNKYSVYMHDTTGKYRFKSRTKNMRVNSSGCIRLEKPITLLNHITTKYTDKSIDFVTAKYRSRKRYNLNLVNKIPIHTTYLTTFIDENNRLIVSDDIYGFDKSQRLNF